MRARLPLSSFDKQSNLLPAAAFALLLLATGCRGKQTTSNGKPVAAPNTAKYADTLTPLIAAKSLPFLRWPDIADFQPLVQTFYNNRELQLAWSRDGKPSPQAAAMIAAFAAADKEGLNPEDYDTSRWQARVQALASDDYQAVAQFDIALTLDAMRLVSDLHMGRVAPQHFNFEIDTQSKKLDLPQFLNDRLLESSGIPDVLRSLEPDSDDFRKTKDALHHYQDLARQQTDPIALPDPGRNLGVGDRYIARGPLEQRLALEGDGDFERALADTPDAAAQKPGPLTVAESDAIKAYQSRHGISPDGKLGSVTVRSLNVPLSKRVQQLSDALERWRWLPDPYLHPRLMVNLPEFLLRGYTPENQLDFTMRTVIGKAEGNHDTPVFTHMMKFLIFRPFWNVPVSIIKKELVPHIQANPHYLEEKNYEVVGHSGKPITDYTATSIEHGGYLIREKPGPTNSLGLVKFMFPNQYDIYLHSTPAVGLFQRQRRDFSHGCVRVQHPDNLAVWVLDGQNGKDNEPWDLEHVQAAMNDGEDNKQVSLKTQLPVVIFYLTAHVDQDGKVDFFDDLYNYDADLDQTLEKGPPYPTKPNPVTPKTEPGDTV